MRAALAIATYLVREIDRLGIDINAPASIGHLSIPHHLLEQDAEGGEVALHDRDVRVEGIDPVSHPIHRGGGALHRSADFDAELLTLLLHL